MGSKLCRVDKNFIQWLKSNPRYSGLPLSKATFRFYKDHTDGRYVDTARVTRKLEEMFYGKKK